MSQLAVCQLDKPGFVIVDKKVDEYINNVCKLYIIQLDAAQFLLLYCMARPLDAWYNLGSITRQTSQNMRRFS